MTATQVGREFGTSGGTGGPGPSSTGAARSTPRAKRPFWGGLLLTLGGTEILLTEKASLKVVMHVGMQGLAGYLLPTVMLLCGLLILFNPTQRLFYSIIGILLSLGTWLTSNLGGFLIGLLLGATGSCLTFGWLPDQEPRRGLLRRRRTQSATADSAAS
ncbi:DUF6114 domain-containing protein [Streptomyces colonosanans]|uniref:Integral membrane protein n=1 Tax=Streptomyces colonosanans TaxID=1428652 RepID=A0A1S2PT02_9ACTN|nr:DUF6114 domain-containing protein [Streptomyces colonosanans]OIJ96893.1 hypothetical protein BIV24_07640 [Streptomyces colonosanans]